MHYYFFGIIGPIFGAGLIILFKRKIAERFLLKAAIGLTVASVVSLLAQLIVTCRCEIAMLGESVDRIYDIGLVIITLPIFFIFFMFCFAALVLVHSRTNQS